jgi:DNA-binding transcriptional LysR family regulator
VSPELRQLRYFVAVAEELNFTRAAQRMYIVQQALSSAIRQFERQLGVELFVRTTRRVELTSAGEALLPYARQALDATERGMEALSDTLAGRSGRLRVGLAATSGLALTPILLQHFEARWPEVELSVRHFDFRDPSGGVADGSSDVGIVRPPLSTLDFGTLELIRERRCAVLAATHRLAHRTLARMEDLVDEPWVRLDTDVAWRDFWSAAEQRARPSPPGPLCRSLDDVMEAARSKRGIGLVPESVADAQGWPGLSFVPVVDIPLSSVVIAWRLTMRSATVGNFIELASRLGPAHRDDAPKLLDSKA